MSGQKAFHCGNTDCVTLSDRLIVCVFSKVCLGGKQVMKTKEHRKKPLGRQILE